MTANVTDEMIMALADGVLEGPEAEAVREAIAASSALQEKFETFQQSRRLLAGGFDGLLERPLPEEMKKLVMEHAAPGGTVVSLEHARARRGRLFNVDALSKVAAAVALLGAAALSGYQFGQNEPAGDGLVLAGLLPEASPVAVALSSAASGALIDIGGSEFAAVATYEIEGGQVCREFELDRGESGTVGLACRVEGGWQVEVAVLNVTAGAKNQFLPASADAFELVGAALDAKGEYEAVDPETEACILGGGACIDPGKSG